jgi:hypothetical protein
MNVVRVPAYSAMIHIKKFEIAKFTFIIIKRRRVLDQQITIGIGLDIQLFS